MRTIATPRLLACLVLAPLAACCACACPPPPAPAVALAEATAVFTGRVVGIHVLEAREEDPVAVTLQVELKWKGITQDVVVVYTERGAEEDCGFLFLQGQPYLVYCTGSGERDLHTDRCTRTRLLVGAEEEVAALGNAARLGLPAVGPGSETGGLAPAPPPAQTPPGASPRERTTAQIILTAGFIIAILGVFVIAVALMRSRSSLSFPASLTSRPPGRRSSPLSPEELDPGDHRPGRTPRRHQGR